MLAVAPWVIYGAPHEATMGLVYKIFFFHFPSAWLYLIGAIVAGVCSGIFLFGGNRKMDSWALAAAEMTVLFGAITLVTGPLWARKAWGVWWVWDARLTSSLMVWMVFVAYLILRRFGGPGSDKLGAGMALFGLAAVPVHLRVGERVAHASPADDRSSRRCRCPWAVRCGSVSRRCSCCSWRLLSMRARLERQRVRIEELYLAEDEA